MISYAVLSLKGGVGKTTIALNLGAALSALDRRVLLVDLDTQHDLTFSLGVNAIQIKGIEFLLENDLRFEDILIKRSENLHLLPAGKKLKDLELSLSNMIGKRHDSYFSYLLKNALEPYSQNYDYLFIDCPPALGSLTINALSWVQHVVLPVQCQHLGFEATKKTVSYISKMRKFNNPEVRASVVVATMYDVRNKLSEQIIERLVRVFNGRLMRSVIRTNVSLAEAPGFGKTIFEYKPDSHGANDFQNLAYELITKFE